MADITLHQAKSVLQDKFGLSEFRPKQLEVIARVFQGKSTLALLATGYGKSICYQVPSQVMPGVTVVISPLIALMQDQLAGLHRHGIRNATVLNSSVSFDGLRERFAGIRSGAYKLIYVAPERFESSYFRSLLQNIDISLLVIDEAHCISQWGHDFRPQYRNLHEYTRDLPVHTILALTATATSPVRSDIQKCLGLPADSTVECSFDRPNLVFEVKQTASNEEKDRILAELLRNGNLHEPSIVYTSSRKEAERVADILRSKGFSAGCYHAGMPPDLRAQTQKRFEDDVLKIIVCTVAFGMGVDKSNIRRVIHYNLPGSLENYYQEAGRAGRDGNDAVCTLLYQAKDIRTQKFFIQKNYPSDVQVQQIWNYVRKNTGCSFREALSQTGIDESAFNSAIDFLKQTKRIATASGGTLIDSNPCVLIPAPLDTALLNRRKQAEETRLRGIIAYAQDNTCRRKAILEYFGQRLNETCSGCDVCNNQIRTGNKFIANAGWPETDSLYNRPAGIPALGLGPQDKLPANQIVYQTHKLIFDIVITLRMNVGRVTTAQILTGSRSKRFCEKGYTDMQEFGSLCGKSQDDVIEQIDELIAGGHLMVTVGLYPVLALTPQGRRYYATLCGR